MADNTYGIYVSVRNTDGVLISVSRADWATAKEDLSLIFGDDYADNIISGIAGSAMPPATVTVLQGEDGGDVMSPGEVQEALGGPAGSPAFEKCEKCGGVKDQWKPPGVSKAGKKYSGFYGCSNWRNH